jgi:hypothetical protein
VTVSDKEIYVADREGMRPPISLSLGERVVRTGAKGCVGAAITTERLLVFADGQPAVEHRWRMGESGRRLVVGAHVAVAASSQRVLLFEQGQGQLHDVPVATAESVGKLYAYEDIALAVTARR